MSTKKDASSSDPLDREIDFSEGVHGFHAARRKGKARLVLIEGELARQFKSTAEVTAALRAYLKAKGRRTTAGKARKSRA
jgi:hypothetical protein